MLSNRVKRNIWLTLSVLSIGPLTDRIIRCANGTLEWWSVVATVIITAFCIKFYLDNRRKVKRGILFGNSNPFRAV